ncbi:MAG: hypothetical protein A3D44_00865 [Candidatus Staskawiczbacteria bacterium RIFCSPHIGHO2_02_FULL_42_22]|uniref:dCTP deaminase n=1 Tax=Candidatus Staskawiczbacteria bacterium RIFCSPHIGHO2_02_FULL_42_22 TaxID=1802207 RepID=A0A1G2I322_9BACT|nr:MAG: hypothetical protein A3D44_00865 [Candidatus Staskawiczbacteria bacterium RIFCSPHIGHO2_02_FULL_42_22]
MILTNEEIKEAIVNGEMAIDPFDEENLKPASYSFTLGNKFKKLKKVEFLDSRIKEQEFEEFELNEDGYFLQPGEFIICHTAETLKLGKNIACFLTMRGAKAQMGIDALSGEIFCEPGSGGGWDGKLMLETTNKGPLPVKLFPGITIIKAVFMKV